MNNNTLETELGRITMTIATILDDLRIAITALVPLAITALVLSLFLWAQQAAAEERTVRIDNFTFNPAELKVKPGTTITWENADDIPHSIVETGTKFHSKALDTGDKFSMTFADAGEIDYFCGLHPHMKGKIIVTP